MLKYLILINSLLFCTGSFAASSYDLRQFLDLGGSISVGSSISNYAVQELVKKAGARVEVRCAGFSAYNCANFSKLGAKIILDSSFSSYEVQTIIKSSQNPLNVMVVE